MASSVACTLNDATPNELHLSYLHVLWGLCVPTFCVALALQLQGKEAFRMGLAYFNLARLWPGWTETLD